MTQQRLKGRNVSPLKGVLVILGLTVSIVLVSWVERAIAMSTGFQYGSFVVWALVVAEVLAITRLGVMEVMYQLDENHFVVQRVYGQNGRPVHDIPVASLVDVGAKDDMFRRYGNAQAFDRATMKTAPYPEMALVYRKASKDEPQLLLIQPDEHMLQALQNAIHPG